MRFEFIDGDFDSRRIRIDDAEQVLAYLQDAEVLRAAVGEFPDAMNPKVTYRSRGEVTDGELIWSEAVSYYVERYRLAPPERLLTHIREQAYQCPPVSSVEARSATKAVRRRGSAAA